MQISETQYKFQKIFFVLKIISFELVARVSPKFDENMCDRPSTC